MSSSSESPKAPMTHEERLALAAKLDRELDEFIDGLEKKRYTDGWPEDRWEEEMDKHPFFMKSSPADGALSPLAEGLANLKYDPDENTPIELATSYKEDGNFNYKHKNYRLAIIAYTEGIKTKCEDTELMSSLYNNRAAANFLLKNYRTALADSEKAFLLNENHTKALSRAAKAAFEIADYDKCIQHCQKYAQKQECEEIKNMLKEAKSMKLIKERDERKKKRRGDKKEEEKDEVIKAIKNRGIRIFENDDYDDLDLAVLEPTFPGSEGARVHLENGELMWPVLIMFREFGTLDFIKDCPENVPLKEQLEQLFPTPWDTDEKYNIGTINVYYEGSDKKMYKVDIDAKLSDVLLMKNFVLKAGTPAFVVVVRKSAVEKDLLQS